MFFPTLDTAHVTCSSDHNYRTIISIIPGEIGEPEGNGAVTAKKGKGLSTNLKESFFVSAYI